MTASADIIKLKIYRLAITDAVVVRPIVVGITVPQTVIVGRITDVAVDGRVLIYTVFWKYLFTRLRYARG